MFSARLAQCVRSTRRWATGSQATITALQPADNGWRTSNFGRRPHRLAAGHSLHAARSHGRASAQPGARPPITLGHGYSTLVWVPEKKGSWALPLLHERIPSHETPFSKAGEQPRHAQSLLPQRAISLWDAEYGCAHFLLATADIPADKIIRLRPNLRLFGAPVFRKGLGRPPVHGAKFKFKDPTTWWQAEVDVEMLDPDLGKIRIRIWNELHFQKAPSCPLRVACVERLESKGTRRLPKLIWVAWVGEDPPGASITCAAMRWITGIVLPNSACTGQYQSSVLPNKANAGVI